MNRNINLKDEETKSNKLADNNKSHVEKRMKQVKFSTEVSEIYVEKVGKKRKLYTPSKLTEPAVEINDFKSTAYEIHILKEKNRKLEFDAARAKSDIIWLKDSLLKMDSFLSKKFPKKTVIKENV
jgi:hypothetical protein